MTGKKSGTTTAGSATEEDVVGKSLLLKEGTLKKLLVIIGVFALILPLLFLGCEGDDGSQGIQGIQGPPGPPGAGAAAQPESCSVCHGDTSDLSVTSVHAITGVATVSNAVATPGASVDITFDVAVDGVPNDSFTSIRRAYVNFDNAALADPTVNQRTTFQRITITDNVTLTPNGGGNYTATVPDAFQIDNATYLIQLQSATSTERPVAVATLGTRQLRDLVTNDGCMGCHGPYPAWSEKFRHYAVGGPDCQICHSRDGRITQVITRDDTGVLVLTDNVAFGTNLTEYIHGIHNSHHMPPDGTYFRTTEDVNPDVEDRYSIGYPSDMRDCRTCHRTNAQLAAAASAPVSYYLCMTCHNNWDGFVDHHTGDQLIPDTGGLAFHRGFAPDVNCMAAGCHGSLPAKDEAADFHIDLEASDRHYDSFFGGEDISFANNNDVGFAITGVTKAGDNVTFTWTASRLGAAVDPCNDNLANGPVFSDLGAYLAYAKGDDWVNEFVGTSPGQPLRARNLFSSLTTTCAANVATTTGLTIAPGTSYASKVLLAIGGKPIDRDTFLIGATPTTGDYFVRFPSPTFAFSMADGSAVPARRDAVATEKCLACHRGTLYQHGGDRVDNEQLCVICHNPSSADKNNRLDRFQIVNADNTVNTDATYDGKVNETFDMRTMIHGIHGVSKREKPWVIYRGRGIYAFPPPVYEEIGGDLFERAYPFPTGWPADGMTIGGSTNGSTISHNWIVVHYPKRPNECTACHNAGGFEPADQTVAVALTVDPGGPDYQDQSDDVVIGPTAAGCIACHAAAPVRSHANQFGYNVNATKDELLLLAQ